MPICAYFVSGKCSYGNKCHNSHIDVQAMVQAEMKAALNGKQWPLSTFSPFKDEPSLPDLLDDQSFEEVRWNFLLAKAENRLPQYQEDFKRVTAVAFDKMSKMAMPDAGVKKYLVDIYGLNGRKTRQMTSTQSTFGNPSIFDRISSNAVTEASSVFGGGTTTTVAGGFGGNSVFGGNSTFTAQPKSIFGQQSVFSQQQQQPAQSIFNQNQQTNSIFKPAQLSAVQPASGGNIFTQSMQQQPQQSAFGGQSAFSSTTNAASSIFGGGFSNTNTQPMSTESLFGGANATSVFGQNQNASVFAQNPPTFGQNSQNPPAFGQTPSVFGQTHSQFGQPVVAPPSFTAQTAPQSVFGQPPQPAPPVQPQPMSVFSPTNPPQQQQQNVFQAVSQSPGQQSVFAMTPAQEQANPPVSSVFATPSPYEASNPATRTSVFSPATNAFAPADSSQKSANQAYLYSKLEDLTPEQLQAFQADTFEMGKIPTVPPPVDLCAP
ncbi:hypothetical protein DMENIID0001_022230 [Sergentomyia squamirostris]